MMARTGIMLTVLAVLCMAAVAQADITVLNRQNYEEINLSLSDFTPLDEVFGFRLAAVAAITYDTPQSQPIKNLQVDFGDNFVGISIRKDLWSGQITPYVAYKPMMRNTTLSDWHHVLAVGVDGLQVAKNITIGAEWQTCRERGDENLEDGRLMFTVLLKTR